MGFDRYHEPAEEAEAIALQRILFTTGDIVERGESADEATEDD